MATDPIQSIRERMHESALDLDAHRVLIDLAALPASVDAPYLTVSLDWRPDGGDPGRVPAAPVRPSERRSRRSDDGVSRRPARQQMEQEIAEWLARHESGSPAFKSLSADAERIAGYLDGELDPSAQGVFIVSCSAADIFAPLALGVPIPTNVTVSPTPLLSTLARLVDDYPTYAVLLADQREATLSFVTQAIRDRSVTLESTDYPRKQQQGGWSQRRFQARADERVAAFARGIADETQRALDELGVDMLILAGDEVITSALDAEFHQSVKDRIIGSIRLDIGATDDELIAATAPIAHEAERRREADAVQAMADGVGSGGNAVAGIDATLTAVQGGQVATLLLNDDAGYIGWADYSFPLLGVGVVPSLHPAAGDPAAIVPVALEEELIRLTLLNGGAIQIVKTASGIEAEELEEIPEAGSEPPRSEPAKALDDVGGVGALLRFTVE